MKSFIKISLSCILTLFCSTLIFSAIATPVFAVPEGSVFTEQLMTVGNQTGLESGGQATLEAKVGDIIKTFLGFLGIILVIVIIYAGFLWMTAGGNPEQVKKGQAWLKNGVIGIVIILMAYIITTFVINAILPSA